MRISKLSSDDMSSSRIELRWEPTFSKWQITRSESTNSALHWIGWLPLRKNVRCQEAPLKRPECVEQLNLDELINPLPVMVIRLQSFVRTSQRPSPPIFSNLGGISAWKKKLIEDFVKLILVNWIRFYWTSKKLSINPEKLPSITLQSIPEKPAWQTQPNGRHTPWCEHRLGQFNAYIFQVIYIFN